MFKTSIYRYVDRCWSSMVSNKYSFENCKKKKKEYAVYSESVFPLRTLFGNRK